MSRSKYQKRWDRLPQSIKVMNRQLRRARENQAVRERKEPPLFKQTDRWDAF